MGSSQPLTDSTSFASVPGVRSVPVIRNWRALAAGEFLARTDTPLVFEGLGAGTKASGWDRDFFRAFGDQLVRVRAAADVAGAEIVQQLRPLREFIAALDAGEDGVYAAEWYLFKDCPHLVRDVVEGFPAYLLDDWLECIPPPLAFGSDTRNNVYWGANGSCTPVHYDSLNACTWNLTVKGVKRWLLFSAREFRLSSPQCWTELRARGLLAGKRAFHAGRRPRVP